MKKISLCTLALVMTACGGGGGNDPSAYNGMTAGAGSTTVAVDAAAAQATIKYGQYLPGDVNLSDKSWTLSAVSATVNYDPSSKQGSIQFPLSGASETVSTTDGYATASWSGPLSFGAYRFHGNILLGCSGATGSGDNVTQVFVSSSLPRVLKGNLDDMSGNTFDVFDCAAVKQGTTGTLTINADGSMALSVANTTFPKNQVFDMLNPELYPSIVLSVSDYKYKGFYSGHAYRYDADNVTRYAIVLQTNAGATTQTNRYHYYLAIQR